MTCRDEGEGATTARVCERTLARSEHIERRRPVNCMDLHDNGQCKRVTFGCGHRDDYDKLRKLVFDSEEGYDKASHDKAIERGHDNEVFFVGNRAAVYGCDAEAVPVSDEDVIPKLGGHTP